MVLGKEYILNKPDNKLRGDALARIMSGCKASLFHQKLDNYHPTPLISLNSLSHTLGLKSIFIKDESARYNLNAFKALGASYAIKRILEINPEADTFCTASDGNHGRAVAWSASREGKRSRIFVPAGTSESRIRAIEDEGGVVTVFQGTYDETCRHASDESRKNGWNLIQDTSSEDYEEIPALIMAGYTTMFSEMEDQLCTLPSPGFDIVLLQAGVGSFAASAIWYLLNRYGELRPKLVIVEPKESDGILESFRLGERSAPGGTLNTIMAGLNCGIPSLTAWEIIRSGSDAALTIDDLWAEIAIRRFYFPQGSDQRIVSGESGAAGLGGLLRILNDHALEPLKNHIGLSSKSRVLLINTEGATDPVSFDSIIGSA